MLAWHFLKEDGCTGNANPVKVFPGMHEECYGKIVPCKWGLHASARPLHALAYAPSAIVQRVELGGHVFEYDDKFAASERTCLWVADATKVLREFALWCAEQAIASQSGLPGYYQDAINSVRTGSALPSYTLRAASVLRRERLASLFSFTTNSFKACEAVGSVVSAVDEDVVDAARFAARHASNVVPIPEDELECRLLLLGARKENP